MREYQRFSFPEACEWLGAEHHLPARTTLQQPVKPSTIDRAWLSNLVQTPHLTAEARQFLFEERGIRQSVVRWLNVSSIAYDVPMGAKAGSGIFRAPAILLPYYDECGNLQSVQARYLGPAGKSYRFQFPKGGVCGIYNKPIATRLNDGDDLYLAEGVTDCMALLSSGRKSLAIPSATLLKASDTEWLKQLADSKHLHLHIYPDQDEPGERLFLRLRDTFPDIERHQLPIGCKDYGSYWKMIKDN